MLRRLLGVLITALFVAGGLTASTPLAREAAPSASEAAPTALEAHVPGDQQPTLSIAALEEPAVEGISALGEVTGYVVGTPMEISYKGDLPAAGATLSRTYAGPLPEDTAATFAYWDEEFRVWTAVPTALSEDRRTITAIVHRFSIWNDIIAGGQAAIEGIRDTAAAAGQAVSEWVGKAVTTTAEALHWSLGNIFTTRVELPECDFPTPNWVIDLPVGTGVDDPVRFCAGYDAGNPDLLVIKARANRGYGFPVNLAVSPAWEYNSTLEENLGTVIDTVGELDVTVGQSVGQLLNGGRFVGPGDEISFGIAASSLRDYSAEFLLELPAPSAAQFIAMLIAGQLTAWGISRTDGLLGATIMVASCWSKVANVSDVGNGAGAVLTCLLGADTQIAQLLGEVFLAKGMEAKAAGQLAGRTIGRASVALALLPAVLSTFDYAAELGLPRNARGLTVSVDQDALDAVPGFPAPLQGRWCTRLADAEQECFSLAEMLDRFPELTLDYSSPSETVPGATDYALCLVKDLGDSCTMAASASYRYFPTGVDWDCNSMNGFDLVCGDPDYSDEHDTSVPRLVQLYNHQQDVVYRDSAPMYRE